MPRNPSDHPPVPLPRQEGGDKARYAGHPRAPGKGAPPLCTPRGLLARGRWPNTGDTPVPPAEGQAPFDRLRAGSLHTPSGSTKCGAGCSTAIRSSPRTPSPSIGSGQALSTPRPVHGKGVLRQGPSMQGLDRRLRLLPGIRKTLSSGPCVTASIRADGRHGPRAGLRPHRPSAPVWPSPASPGSTPAPGSGWRSRASRRAGTKRSPTARA